MEYPLTKQIYDILLSKCGEHKKILGASNTLKQMSEGRINLTLKTVSRLFNDNGLPAELNISVKVDGKKGKTKIKL